MKKLVIFSLAILGGFFVVLALITSLNVYSYNRDMNDINKKFNRTVWVRTSASQPSVSISGGMNFVANRLRVGEMMRVENVSSRKSGIADTFFEAKFTSCGDKKNVDKATGFYGDVFGFESVFKKVEDPAVIAKCFQEIPTYSTPTDEYNNSVWRKADKELYLKAFQGEGVNPLKDEVPVGGIIKITNVHGTDPKHEALYSFTYTNCANRKDTLSRTENLVYLEAFEEIYERVDSPDVIASCQ